MPKYSSLKTCYHCRSRAGDLIRASHTSYCHAACYLETGKPLEWLPVSQWTRFPDDLLEHYDRVEELTKLLDLARRAGLHALANSTS